MDILILPSVIIPEKTLLAPIVWIYLIFQIIFITWDLLKLMDTNTDVETNRTVVFYKAIYLFGIVTTILSGVNFFQFFSYPNTAFHIQIEC